MLFFMRNVIEVTIEECTEDTIAFLSSDSKVTSVYIDVVYPKPAVNTASVLTKRECTGVMHEVNAGAHD